MTSLAVRSFLTMLVVVDPVGLVPMFLVLCTERAAGEKRQIARRAVATAAGILLAFALGGSWLLTRLGISLGAFQVAGGILLFWIAVRMVFAEHQRETAAEAEEARSRPDVSIFPLAIPIIAGPGSMASILILMGEARASLEGTLIVLAATGIVLLSCYLALRLSEPLARVLGQTGINVVTRVLGVLLAALAVQYVADGALIVLHISGELRTGGFQ
jgi:multiple antibiotic resistance protein